MSEYLFPTPGSGLKSLLDYKAKTGGVFSEKEATIDIMLSLDTGQIKPERYLAKRWSWSASKVHRSKPNLIEKAGKWRRFEGVKQTEARVKQTEARIGQKSTKKRHFEAEVKQAEAEVKQGDYIYPRATDTELQITDKKNLNNLTTSAKGKEQSLRPDEKSRRVKSSKVKVSEMVFEKGDWRWQFAKGFYDHLNKRSKLGTPLLSNPSKTLLAWCHVFRKLNDARGYSKESIYKVCQWLFSDSKQARWWIDGGKLGTAEKLLDKTRSGDKYIFELLQIQMNDEQPRNNNITDDQLAAETLRLARAS